MTELRTPDAVSRMRADFDRQGAMASMGITVGDVAPGRTLTFTQGRAVAIDGAAETTVATLTATMMAVRGMTT